MKIEPTALPEVLHIKPDVHRDQRGMFLESWHLERYREAGIAKDFVQDNFSGSYQGTLRGLHYQYPHPQGKLVSVVSGRVLDVAVDIRVGSPRFGQWVACELDDERREQLWVPEGFAHGFCVLSEWADLHYKCTEVFRPENDRAILWNDPELGVRWPLTDPNLSARDSAAPRLSGAEVLPRYSPA